ncbi:hypothetical protein [Nonomuraea soli]|uniref:Adenine/guanine phosphoribosyltransferase-like PRPP-binding protein n=1 Tax=Nonomuraea soli TaxID=1032476 RepID=A0A7W0HPV5_9ACTN|nr:hypothetical protein [Nonomuraea soli]MBA2891263.1 adenine/guanine phosphoribosyltransferase-like PRPP-binding protein [Nonomuraea soli]
MRTQVEQALATLLDGQEKADVLTHPAAAEEAGRTLAARLAGLEPDVLVFWEGVEDAVLGHVVARALGVSCVAAVEVAGILEFATRLPEGARVAVLADAFRTDKELNALLGLVRNRHGHAVAVASLVTSPVTDAYAAAGGTTVTAADEKA